MRSSREALSELLLIFLRKNSIFLFVDYAKDVAPTHHTRGDVIKKTQIQRQKITVVHQNKKYYPNTNRTENLRKAPGKLN